MLKIFGDVLLRILKDSINQSQLRLGNINTPKILSKASNKTYLTSIKFLTTIHHTKPIKIYKHFTG